MRFRVTFYHRALLSRVNLVCHAGGASIKPMQEQIELLKIWLNARLSALFAGKPFPPLPFSIECEMRNSVDFGAPSMRRVYG